MRISLFYFLLFFIFNLSAQDRILLSISDNSITIDDFMATYHKNRLDTDSLTFEDSLKEYLDLYIKFKLKVVEAESLGLDTIPSFIRELEGYRKQLSKPYLTDKEISEELLIEAYDRLKYEVSASHILIQINNNDTIDAYNKITSLKRQLDNGDSDFISLAKRFSEDPSVKENNGDLGYFSALAMVYQFENAAYTTEIGRVSDPVRTRFGYHLVKVNDKRLSRGEVKVAHIMITSDDKNLNNASNSKNKIFEIYDSLISGSVFPDLAKQYSNDKKSAQNGGELDWFGTNKMMKKFEDISFSLDSIGTFSQPFQTDFGWHIVQLLGKKSLPEFKELESSLKKRIERDSRSQKTRDVLINRLKNEWGFIDYVSELNMFYNIITDDFSKGIDVFKDISGNGKVMFELKNNFDPKYRYIYQKDFADFLKSFSSRLNPKDDFTIVISQLYKTFIEQKIIEVENVHLESKYNDFRLLIGEYHDGILLFNLMDEMVWSKAISDTVGLKQFYEDNKINYMWPNRLDVQIYSAKNNKLYKKLYKKIKKGDVDNDLLSCFNKNSELNLSLDNLLVSEGDNMMIDTLLFSLDSVSEGQFVAQDSEYKILYIKSIIPPSYKLLNEIKGLVISDYQLLLEKGWLEQLRNKHAVVLNKELFFLAQQKRLNELPVISDSLIVPNSYTGNFESAFYNAVNELGSSKDIYFEWYGNLYTTELKSLE